MREKNTSPSVQIVFFFFFFFLISASALSVTRSAIAPNFPQTATARALYGFGRAATQTDDRPATARIGAFPFDSGKAVGSGSNLGVIFGTSSMIYTQVNHFYIHQIQKLSRDSKTKAKQSKT